MVRKVFDCRTCRELANNAFRAHHGCPDPDVPAPVDRDPQWAGTPIGRSSELTRVCPGALLRVPGKYGWHVSINGQHPADLAELALFQGTHRSEDAPAPLVELALLHERAKDAAEARSIAAARKGPGA